MVMKPPTGGPISGPISAGIDTHAMASTSVALSTSRSRIRRPTGVIMAPPMPWTMRAMTKLGEQSDRPQADRARGRRPTMAARNTVRAPKRSAVQPPSG